MERGAETTVDVFYAANSLLTLYVHLLIYSSHLAPFYRGVSGGTETLSNLLKVTEQVLVRSVSSTHAAPGRIASFPL